MIRRIGTSLLGGGLAGLALGLGPRLGFFSELRNFQIFILEISYQKIQGLLPIGIIRFLGTAAGELVVLSVIGALIGLILGLVFYGVRFRSVAWGFAATNGVFVFLFGMLWYRIVFVHSSSQRMISGQGLSVLLFSIAAGAAFCFFILGILDLLSRYRLGKIFLVLFPFALLANYFGFPSKTGKVFVEAVGSLPPIKQVVLLGGDGATWSVALPLIREGKLPNLEKMMKEGSWGGIRATLPWKSPIIWTSIATGKREAKHGIHDFVIRDPKTNEVQPISLSNRNTKALWDIASEAGRRVDVVHWYGAWPAEPLNGTMLSYRFSSRELPGRIYPPPRTAELDGITTFPKQNNIFDEEKMAADLGLYLLKKDQPDLHLMYLREIDDMHHFFWKHHALRRGSWVARWLWCNEPKVPVRATGVERGVDFHDTETEGGEDRIENAYLKLDDVLGRILKTVGPETAVMVVSDHGGGIKAMGELRFTLNPVLAQLGFLKFLPDGKKIDRSATRVHDATKRDWYEERELFVNRRAEGPFRGILDEASERALLESTRQKLKSLKTESGQPVVLDARIHEKDKETMRLVVRMNVHLAEKGEVRGEGIQISLSEIFWMTNLTGTHRLNGIFLVMGPGIRAGNRIRAASVLDITPTILYLLKLPVADDMDGRVLSEAIDPSVIRREPVKTIPTYEKGKFHSSSAAGTVTDKELLQRLQSLGYIQ